MKGSVNHNHRLLGGTVCSAVMAGFLVFSAGLSAQGQGADPGLVVVQNLGTMITFAGGTAKSTGALHVRINGPDGSLVFETTSANGIVDFALPPELADGRYAYDVWFTPETFTKFMKEHPEATPNSDLPYSKVVANQAKYSGSKPSYQSGAFVVQGGVLQIEQEDEPFTDRDLSATPSKISILGRVAGAVLDFLVPAASAGTCSSPCDVGTGESQVTLIPSSGSSWEIETASNGSFYRIGPDGGTTEPFKLQAGAPNNSVYIESTGDVGFGTSTPGGTFGAALTITDTFPGILFDDTSGTTRLWSMFGFDDAFTIRNETTGGRVFTIDGTAPLGSVFIDSTGAGFGTGFPASPLHVARGSGAAATIEAQTTGGAATARRMLFLVNNGDPLLRLNNTNNASTWDFRTTSNGFSITKVGTGQLEAEVRNNGDFAIAGSYLTSSSRNLKEDIVPLDNDTVLGKLDQLTVAEWQYIRNPSERHVGPMAEDFYATFGLGPDNKHVVAADMAGVALAAAKALKAENEAKDQQIKELTERISRLEALVNQSR